MTRALVLLAILGCKPTATATATPTDGGRDCSDKAITTVDDLMLCRLGPWQDGKADEIVLRKALERLRDAYPDPDFARGDDPNAWPLVVNRMLESRDYPRGCKDCHGAHMKEFRRAFKASKLP